MYIVGINVRPVSAYRCPTIHYVDRPSALQLSTWAGVRELESLTYDTCMKKIMHRYRNTCWDYRSRSPYICSNTDVWLMKKYMILPNSYFVSILVECTRWWRTSLTSTWYPAVNVYMCNIQPSFLASTMEHWRKPRAITSCQGMGKAAKRSFDEPQLPSVFLKIKITF